MTPAHALSFGVDVTTSAAAGADPIGRARRAESLGFDFVSSNDHPCGTRPSYEVWTMLAWIAASTSRIAVATRVLGVPYRSPAMVAKMAESFDRLSGGRLILGLGGGYSDDEFRAFGLRVPSPKEKVEGLEEAIRIARGLWSESAFTFEGRHHRVLDADVEPKPGRRIPIWLGTFGKRALDVTGRLADGWIPTLSVAPPAAGVRRAGLQRVQPDGLGTGARRAAGATCSRGRARGAGGRVAPSPDPPRTTSTDRDGERVRARRGAAARFPPGRAAP